MGHNNSLPIDHGGHMNFNSLIQRGAPHSLIGGGAAIDYQISADRIQYFRNRQTHRLVIDLLFIRFDASIRSNGAIFSRNDYN